MKVYVIVCISHAGEGESVSQRAYLSKETADQKVKELDLINLEHPCRGDFHFTVRELEVER